MGKWQKKKQRNETKWKKERMKKPESIGWFMLSSTFAVCFVFCALDAFIYGICVHLYLLHFPTPFSVSSFVCALFTTIPSMSYFVRFSVSFHIPIQINAICRTRFRSSASKVNAFVISHTHTRLPLPLFSFFYYFDKYSIFFYCTNAHTHAHTHRVFSGVHNWGGVHTVFTQSVQCLPLLRFLMKRHCMFSALFLSFVIFLSIFPVTMWVYIDWRENKITVLPLFCFLYSQEQWRYIKCGTRNMVTANKLIGSIGVKRHFIGFTKSAHTESQV